MSRTCLIVEDEGNVGTLVADAATELGYAVQNAKNGPEAVEMISRGAPDVAVVDLVLGDMDGFQVVDALRARADGGRAKVIVVSGVYKQLSPAQQQRLQGASFLAKPFEMGALRQLLAAAAGMDVQQAGAGVTTGNFLDRPAMQVLWDEHKKKATGVLEVAQREVRKRLYLEKGMVRFAVSNVKAENAGGMQVAAGQIKQAAFDRAVSHAKQNRVPLHEALAVTRALNPDQLKEALRKQTLEVAVGAMPWTDGGWSFTPGEVSQQPDCRISPLQIVLDAAKRHPDAQHAVAFFADKGAARLARTPELDKELFAIRHAFPGEAVTAFCNGRTAVADALKRAKPEELALLHVLVGTGLATLEQEPGAQQSADALVDAERSRLREEAAAIEEDRGKVFTPAEAEARKKIFGERERTRELDHYQVLGVRNDAPPEEIKAAYLKLARVWHADAFSGMDLGAARRGLNDVFQKVNESFQTLQEKGKRAEYDVYLDRKAKGLPTDVAAILKAENVFRKGEVLFKAGKYKDAEDCFREATTLNHAEAEFWAYLGITRFRIEGKGAVDEALGLITKALEMQENLVSAMFFRGVIAHETGDVKLAAAQYKKVLEMDEKHVEAQAAMRRLRNPPKEEGKGLFSRLFKRS